jgi:23S rRNA-intervening sequence protein
MPTDASERPFDIKERTFCFAVRLVKLCRAMGKDQAHRVLSTQLLRSGTSIGANVEEAQAGDHLSSFLHFSFCILHYSPNVTRTFCPYRGGVSPGANSIDT